MIRRWLFVFCTLLYSASGSAASCEAPAADASRIAVAGGSLTEILYLLGEEQRIVAVDTTSNYPEAATALPSVGYVRALSAEGVLSLDPTLVLGEHDVGPPEVVNQLKRTGVDLAVVPEAFTVEGILGKVRCVMTLLGYPEARKAAVLSELPIAEVDVSARTAPLRVMVLLGIRDGVPVAAGRETSGDGLLAMAGAENAFAAIEGWKPIALEAMAEAQPDYIVIPERGVAAAGGLEALRSHPAIRLTPASRKGRIIAMDGMTILGFGPRTLTAARDLAERLRADG